ncbi:MAG: signal peptidase I [Proteobacteria bacterium]|nr:signal peptidase I [Pseudomonadota bacterium]
MTESRKFQDFIFPPMGRLYILRVAAVALCAWLFFSYVLVPIQIRGGSMEPAYSSGGWNFIWRLSYLFSDPERGDVVGVRFAGGKVMLLKRVVALEGEEVEFRKGSLFINGLEIDEAYLKYRGNWQLPPRRVKRGNVYVIGDNRGVPMRNHTFGQTPIKRILGAPLF